MHAEELGSCEEIKKRSRLFEFPRKETNILVDIIYFHMNILGFKKNKKNRSDYSSSRIA